MPEFRNALAKSMSAEGKAPEAVTVSYGSAKEYCCEARMYIELTGSASAVFGDCECP